jgi:hypothetical protein
VNSLFTGGEGVEDTESNMLRVMFKFEKEKFSGI